MGREKLHEQPSGRLIESLKMERVRTILTHGYPYPHVHSRHFMISKTIKPTYSNCSRWYVAWIFLPSLYHLPSFRVNGIGFEDESFPLPRYLYFLPSFLDRLPCHISWTLVFVSCFSHGREKARDAYYNPKLCSDKYSLLRVHCGNRTLSRDKSIDRRTASWVAFSLWRKQTEDSTLISKLLRMHKFKDQICSSLFDLVGSSSDYPLLSKWAIYGELSSNGAEHSNIISPVYSLWATFIGLYMANYIVERSTGWALTHPLTISKYENLKKLLKPDFEDMIPWYSGTSTDLFKTVFDLMISVTLFVGRFDMRMMQAGMNKSPDESKSIEVLYDHLDRKVELRFDFIVDTGNGGNSTYAIARLLAQPSLVVKSDDSRLIFPRGELLLIGGDIRYPNPCSFTYMISVFFCPFEYALQPRAWYTLEHIAWKNLNFLLEFLSSGSIADHNVL